MDFFVDEGYLLIQIQTLRSKNACTHASLLAGVFCFSVRPGQHKCIYLEIGSQPVLHRSVRSIAQKIPRLKCINLKKISSKSVKWEPSYGILNFEKILHFFFRLAGWLAGWVAGWVPTFVSDLDEILHSGRTTKDTLKYKICPCIIAWVQSAKRYRVPKLAFYKGAKIQLVLTQKVLKSSLP